MFSFSGLGGGYMGVFTLQCVFKMFTCFVYFSVCVFYLKHVF